MDTKHTGNDLKSSYKNDLSDIDQRVSTAIKNISITDVSLNQMKDVTSTIVDLETSSLKNDLETLLEKRDALSRKIEKKADELQHIKYNIFNTIESELKNDPIALLKLHQVKLQSIDLYDILSEMVESAIITALEKDGDGDITEALTEVIKDITYESISEGSLNSIRVRTVLTTILNSSVDIAEATPNRSEKILSSSLRGMRTGLIKAIDRFKQRLTFMPSEAKHILIEDYETIIDDLHQTDSMFSNIIINCAQRNNPSIHKQLTSINKDMAYDIEELLHVSKETAQIIKEKFSQFAHIAVQKADVAINSQKAQEAKRMGVQALNIAKDAINNAIKSAKDAIDK